MAMMSAEAWSALVYMVAAVGLVVFMLVVPRLLGGRSSGRQKEETFEAGVVGAGNARLRLSAKFYLVAIFFVIFDLEALYLYAYAVSIEQAGWAGFIIAVTFIIDLLVGLIYAVKVGALDWSPANKRPAKARIDSQPIGFDLASITKFNGVDELHTDPTGKVPAQSSGRIFAGRKNLQAVLDNDSEQMTNIDHINTTGRITTQDFNS